MLYDMYANSWNEIDTNPDHHDDITIDIDTIKHQMSMHMVGLLAKMMN